MKTRFFLLFILCFLVISSILHCKPNEQKRTYQQGSTLPSPTDLLEIQAMDSGVSVQDMVDLLVGLENTSVEISNVNYVGAPIASGIFRGARDEGIEIDEGVMLSNGFATNFYGPNNSEATTGWNGVIGSSNLDLLIPGYDTYDASILEFDFVPKFNSIGFTYTFGSEEYLEWVGSPYNDVFGLFIDGANIALIPGTGVPVSINNVNNASYSSFYVDNPVGLNYYNVQPDGMTTAISVSRMIEPDVTHHISFEIADAGDYILDSWVLLEAGSFHSVQCTTFFEVIIVEGTDLQMYEDEELEIHAIARGEDAANFSWSLYQPQNGTVSFISADIQEEERTILYVPNEDFNGLDYFVLTVMDGLGGIINQFIEIEVLPVRDAPVCENLPHIWGNFELDGEVYCDPGDWNDDKDNQYAPPGVCSTISLTYQWQKTNSNMDWIDIENAVDSLYTITEDEIDHYIRCNITAIDTGIGIGLEDTTEEHSNEEYCAGPSGISNLINSIGFTEIYPNPFNPDVYISYYLKNQSEVDLQIFNARGQLVRTITDKVLGAGKHTAYWNGKDQKNTTCSSGLYFVKLQTVEGKFIEKILLMK